MVRITVTSKPGENLYGAIVKKEVALSRSNQGTFFRSGKKMKGFEKWAHKKYDGWIWLQKCLGGIVVAEVKTRAGGSDTELFKAFLGFLDRHFASIISSITIAYE